MSKEAIIKVNIQEENTMEDNSTKLSLTEFSLAVVIESTENDVEKIVTVSVPCLSQKHERGT